MVTCCGVWVMEPRASPKPTSRPSLSSDRAASESTTSMGWWKYGTRTAVPMPMGTRAAMAESTTTWLR